MALFRRKKATKRKTTRRKTTKRKTTKRKVKKKGGKKKPFGGYQIVPDAKIGAVIGTKPVTPAQMTKKIWQYIKRHRLSRRG